MSRISLSAVSVGMRPAWAAEAMNGFVAPSVEMLCHKSGTLVGRKEESWIEGNYTSLSAFHASYHAVLGYEADIASGSLLRKWEMTRWLQNVGGVEDLKNPSLALARSYNISVVVHAGTILELRSAGISPGTLFSGVHLRIENNDSPCPWNAGVIDGVPTADEVARYLIDEYGLAVGFTLDLEHLAHQVGWDGTSQDQYMDALYVAADRIGWGLESVHVCDYDPTMRGFKAGQHLMPGKGKLPLRQALRCLSISFPDVEFVLEAPGGVLPFAAGYVFGLGRKRAIANAKLGLDFISRHIG